MVRLIANKTEGKLPIVAVGGIMSEQDALDMLDAGASLIQSIPDLSTTAHFSLNESTKLF